MWSLQEVTQHEVFSHSGFYDSQCRNYLWNDWFFNIYNVCWKNKVKTKLKQNRDYIVSYSQNKKVGTAVITITGKGNYSGTVKKYFEIKK